MPNLLIDIEQQDLVVCDNPNCNFHVPYTQENKDELPSYLNVACPKCGENLLTEEDLLQSEKFDRVIKFINKWFSWLNYLFFWKKKKNIGSVHIHNGINIQK